MHLIRVNCPTISRLRLGPPRSFIRVSYLALGTWHIPLFGRGRHYFPIGHHSDVDYTAVVGARVLRLIKVVTLSLESVRLIDLNLSFIHLSWKIVCHTFLLLLLDYFVILSFISMGQVQHMIEPGRGNRWPYNDFFPVSEASTVMKGWYWESVVHMLQLFLGRQCILDEVRVKAT